MSRREAQLAHAETTVESAEPIARPRWLGFASRAVLVGAWCVAAGLLVVAMLRIFFHDGVHILVWLNAFTRYVYLPAYACLAYALWSRRWTLAGVSVVVVGCHLMWLAPDFVRDRRFEAEAAATAKPENSANRARIFFTNVRASNREFDAMLQEIEEVNPDVIVAVEFSWYWREAFRRAGIVEKYPYNNSLKMGETDRVFYYSRLPVQKDAEERIAGRVVASVNLAVGSGELNLVGLHSPRPTRLRSSGYEVFWNRVLPLVGETPRPLVVVGDFNATQYSSVYQQLQESGLRNAHDERGRGYVTTWPNGAEPLPPIRIDQAMLSPEVNCLNIAEGRGAGSDHKPLILEVQVPAKRDQ